MEQTLSFFSSWKGQFDTSNVYQLTMLRHDYPDHFLPIHYPIHRNTGVYVHDVTLNHQNERMLQDLMDSTLPLPMKQQLFLKYYQDPPLGIDIRYRHGY